MLEPSLESAVVESMYLFPNDGSTPRSLSVSNIVDEVPMACWVRERLCTWSDPGCAWTCTVDAWFDASANARGERLNPYCWDGHTRGEIAIDVCLRDESGAEPQNAMVPFSAFDCGIVCVLASVLRMYAARSIAENWRMASPLTKACADPTSTFCVASSRRGIGSAPWQP